jgi:hypothetical protein
MGVPTGRGGEAGGDKPPTAKCKKAYIKPAFRFERVFETQALSCGKIGSHSTICKINPKAS